MFDKIQTETVTLSTEDELQSAMSYLANKKKPFLFNKGKYKSMVITMAKFDAQGLRRRIGQVRQERQLREAYRTYAQDNINKEGDLEFDDSARVSMNEESNGAYVECWKWIRKDDLPTLRG